MSGQPQAYVVQAQPVQTHTTVVVAGGQPQGDGGLVRCPLVPGIFFPSVVLTFLWCDCSAAPSQSSLLAGSSSQFGGVAAAVRYFYSGDVGRNLLHHFICSILVHVK